MGLWNIRASAGRHALYRHPVHTILLFPAAGTALAVDIHTNAALSDDATVKEGNMTDEQVTTPTGRPLRRNWSSTTGATSATTRSRANSAEIAEYEHDAQSLILPRLLPVRPTSP